MTTIGLISPGEMGASIGAAAKCSGAEVIWAGQDRSVASHERAERAGLSDCGTIGRMVENADIILSVCPPHDARATAMQLSELDYDGLLVESNAIAPQSVREIAENFLSNQVIDGGIVGGPAWNEDSNTCLYLSGAKAEQIASVFDGSPLKTHVISEQIGHASALKMVFAAYTKGSTALLAAILGVAEKEGVRSTLEMQWGESFTQTTHDRLTGNSKKAWRFSGEMMEIATTFADAGFSSGFHHAAADTFNRMADFKDESAADINELLTVLLNGPED